MTPYLIGFALSAFIGVIAYLKKSLSQSGYLAAIILGTVIYGSLSWYGFLLLMVFFISASLMKIFKGDESYAPRNAWQVLCNGGVASLLALLYGIFNHPIYVLLFVVSITVAMSDTWSSELGRLSKKMPRQIFTFKKTTVGLSGSVTWMGILASILAAMVMMGLTLYYTDDLSILLGVLFFGVFGSLLDSMLGVFQVKYRNTLTHDIVENPSQHTVYHQGFLWLSNNLVNLISIVITVLIALFYFVVILSV